MTVLVLGGSGLVGRRLVRRLADEGTPVVACDVVAPPSPHPAGVTTAIADITRLDQILSLLAEHEVTSIALLSYIMGPLMSPQHKDILLACQVNVTGVATVLEAARLSGVSRVVFLSTVGVYGPPSLYGDRAVAEDELLAPASMYGRMKALNETICDRYSALYGLEAVKVRPSSIFGPGSTIWPSRFLERVAVGETGIVQYGPDSRDNVIAVDDLAVLLSTLLSTPEPRHRTYLASGHNVTMGELAKIVQDLMPAAELEFPTPDRRPTYPERFDNSRAVGEFGWQVLSLPDTVRRYLDAVRAEAGLEPLA
ncbi:NAD(P)-dependent oxidoreductase [Amycolatopsis sp.]|uniref:NAD-dependent epimerase/dehydratase family protein n=1 Tax=Amycolatopsis sp. TaxID=37632 RepID=UPI002C2299A6|nr:NAD(P)-dependent oxidoreductase [Amycolatopsis sp.]HVV08135.1 NAD(P)-dependent oxidoreductase [Amycolatopsis sp.]